MNMKFVGFLILFSTAAWAEVPDWIDHSERRVIGGDIIHWGTGDAATPDVALFKARHMAIKTLIEECGGVASNDIIPRKQYVGAVRGGYRAFATVSIDFSTCDENKIPNGTHRINQEIVEGQILYKKLVFGSSEEQAQAVNQIKAIEEAKRQLKDHMDDNAAATEAQIQRLKNDVAQLRGMIEQPVQPVKLPATSSMKVACQYQLQLMADRLTLHAADYHGNMAAPELQNELGAAYQQRKLCQRME